MSLETDDLKQIAVLWVANNYDDFGEPKVDAAEAIYVRWEDRRGTTQDGQGDTVTYSSVVYVSTDIALESVLYLGTLSAYTDDSKPQLYRVVGKSLIPDVKNQFTRRSLFLARLSTALPATN